MAEKSAKTVGLGTKPVSMKLFSAWEQEKTAPNCTPRLCTLNFTRLVVHKPLENDLNSVIIAVKMHNTKRVLRSNEISVTYGSNLDTELDLTFSLQYPHYLKRDGNKLQVMLQRRKKYRNKTILGYKTLAIGQVNMALVLQRAVYKELYLYSDHKENANHLATLMLSSLSSQPVDQGENGRQKITTDLDRSPDIDNESDDDDDQEEWSNDELSDSEAVLEDDGRRRPRKSSLRQMRPTSTMARQQRNIKQKFIALLKRFKITEEGLDSEADHELGYPDAHPDPHDDIDDLIDELEDLSDSGPEMDTVSVVSTPKPRLRPFFQGRGSGAEALDTTKDNDKISDDSGSVKRDSDSHADRDTDQDNALSGNTSPEIRNRSSFPLRPDKEKINRGRSRSYREKKNKKDDKHAIHRRHSAGPTQGSRNCVGKDQPRKALLDQLSVVLGSAEDKLPDNVVLVNTSEWQGQLMVQKLQEKHFKIICTCGDADVKAAISGIVSKLQKYCNSNSKAPAPIKVAIAGGDDFINSVLRPYVDQFSVKSPDWQSYVRFLVIPFWSPIIFSNVGLQYLKNYWRPKGSSCIGKYLGTLDSTYGSLFLDSLWKDTFEKPEISKLDSQEIINRVSKYVSSANGVVQIPVAEAMVMCKGKSGEEESSQIFIPFISEVKIGSQDVMNASIDFDDTSFLVNSPSLSSSPPAAMQLLDKPKADVSTPPSSPNVSVTPSSVPIPPSSGTCVEFMELQVDYWTAINKQDLSEKADKASKKDSNKSTLKTTFKSLLVQRLAQPGTLSEVQSSVFSMMVVTREKKQKIGQTKKKKVMRIGKKAKEAESKSQNVEGIIRLTCTTKSQNYALKVWVDGVEWSSVKFFQLSSQWQTHIKHFPVVVFSNIEPV